MTTPLSTYVVQLAGEQDDFDVGVEGSYHEARVLAEEVAKVCRFDVIDQTGASTVVRKSHELDESLRDRMNRLNARAPRVRRPETMTADVQVSDGEVIVDFPLYQRGMSLPIGILGLLTAASILRPNVGFDRARRAILILLLGQFVAVVFAILLQESRRLFGLTGRWRVLASRDQLRFAVGSVD